MPYINVYVSPVLNQAILDAAQSGGKEWTRSKWLRRLAQKHLSDSATAALLKIIKKTPRRTP